MRWAYGVTTVNYRASIKQTLESLDDGGFSYPHIFVDGCRSENDWKENFGHGADNYQVSVRGIPAVRTFGNWIMTLWELFLRNPMADRYAIFQDDFVMVKDTRAYLELYPYPENGYINLFTWGSEASRVEDDFVGLKRTLQNGRGAVALVFNPTAAQAVLTSFHMVARTCDPNNQVPDPKNKLGWPHANKCVDGAIVTGLNMVGISEYCHHPGLTQHIGLQSSMGNRQHPPSPSFPTKVQSALELVPRIIGTEA